MSPAIRRLFPLVVCLLVWAGSLRAATRTWSGSESSAWSNAANWQEGIAPAAGDALVFPSGGTFLVHNDLPNVTYQSLTVRTRMWLAGNPLTIGGDGITVSPDADTVHFIAGLLATTPQTWTCHATRHCMFASATIDSTVRVAGNESTITVRGSGTVVQQSGSTAVHVGPLWSGTVVPEGGSITVAGEGATAADVEMNVPCDWTGCTATVVLRDTEVRAVYAAGGRVRTYDSGTAVSATLETLDLGPGSNVDMLYSYTPTAFRVANPVSVGGIPFSLGTLAAPAYFLTPGTVHTVIDYTGAGPIDGTFAGLPQGATLRSRNGQRFQISYAGGDGNDVTLTTLEHYSGRTDFDGNGRSEIFWRHAVTGENYRWTMDGPVQTGVAPVNSVPDTNWKVAGTADFDGDGDSDVLWHHALTGAVYMYLMQEGTIQSAGPVASVDTAWQLLATGDYDGDGKADVFWRHGATGQTYVYFMDGRTIEHAAAHSDMATSYTIAGSGDLNGDGTDDLLWRDASTGEIVIWLMDDRTIAQQGQLGFFPGWIVAGVGQFSTRGGYNGPNGITDHKADLILRSERTGTYNVHLMDGTSWRGGRPRGVFFSGNVDPAWKIVSTGDYNRDGASDILWRHGVTGENYLYLVTPDPQQLSVPFTGHALPPVPDTNWQILP